MVRRAMLAVVLGGIAACGGACSGEPEDDSTLTPYTEDQLPGTRDAGKDAGRSSSSSGGLVDGGDSGPPDDGEPYRVDYESVEAGGKTQSYIVVTPKTPPAGKLPVYFMYHGDGGGGEQARASTPVEAVTGQNAVVVYPSCPANPSWDVGVGEGNTWVLGFDAILARVIRERNVDPTRVHVSGHSSGAFFANVLGCFRTEQVTSIGSMAGGAPYVGSPNTKWPPGWVRCAGQGAMPTFVVHDYSDNVVGYDSGRWDSEYWMQVNRCALWGDDACYTGNTNAKAPIFGIDECQELTDSPDGTPVVICSTQGNGHGFWNRFLSTFVQFNGLL